MNSSTLTRHQVQDMLDAAQLRADEVFSTIHFLRDQLQMLFRENLEECNSQNIDPIEVLHKSLCTERTILDAYNRHRLNGNAYLISNQHTREYRKEENIPEELEWFLLRAEVAKYGGVVALPPIYQVESTVAHSQKYTAKPIESTNDLAPPKTTNNRKAGARPNATLKKTSNSKPCAKGKKSTGFGSPSYDKLRDAPSAWLDLPRGNLTLAEMTAFIPHAIKSYDIMDRFLYNGALSGTFADMINQYRHMPYGRIENNSIYRMMKGPMTHRAKNDPTYENWTVAKHATIQKPAGFDPSSVSVAGFSTPVNFNSRQSAAATSQSPPSIPFRDMANGVKIMPSGYDALDLTRCVEHCIKHNDGSWRYPQDFEELVASLGGPTAVHPQHQDDAAISRHIPEKKRMNARRAGARQRDDHGYLKKIKRFEVNSDEEEFLDEGSEESEESEESPADIDSDEVDDEEPVSATKKGAKRKSAFQDDVSDGEKFTQQIGAPSKRSRTAAEDEDYEQTSTRRTSKLGKKSSPKTRAHRSKKPPPSHFRKKIMFEDIDSESDGDAFAGPKRQKKKVVATRSSTRNRGFRGSYSLEKVPETEEGEEREGKDESEDGVEDEPTAKKPFLTSAQMRLIGRNLAADISDAIEGDADAIETTDEDASGDDDDFVL